jgi:hypothetical protein
MVDIQTALQVAPVVFNVIDRVIGRIGKFQAANLSLTNKLRVLYFEVSNNLALLKLVKIDALTGIKPRDEEFALLLNCLEIDVCASILFSFDTQDQEIREFLVKNGKVSQQSENDESSAVKNITKSVLQVMLFIVRKTTTLQKLTVVSSSEKDWLNPTRLGVRIKNIEAHLLFLKKKLVELDKQHEFLIKK